jgi:hypothetical protein
LDGTDRDVGRPGAGGAAGAEDASYRCRAGGRVALDVAGRAVSREFRSLARELRPTYRRRRPVLLVAAGWVLRHLPELLAVLVVMRLWLASADTIGPVWTVAVWSAALAGVLAWRPSRRWLLAGLGCVVTRYRLRTALVELRLTTRAGRLPLVLWLAPTPVGERVWLWCRAGISAEDIADEIDGIRAACCARDVRVVRDRRWAVLVMVDVIRRDPLAAAAPVISPLASRARPSGAAGRG